MSYWMIINHLIYFFLFEVMYNMFCIYQNMIYGTSMCIPHTNRPWLLKKYLKTEKQISWQSVKEP